MGIRKALSAAVKPFKSARSAATAMLRNAPKPKLDSGRLHDRFNADTGGAKVKLSGVDRSEPLQGIGVSMKIRPGTSGGLLEGVALDKAKQQGAAAADGAGPTAPTERPDLSDAKVFGRAVDTRSAHDLFWHYFGGKASPTNNEDARAMMKEMADKFAPFGFTVEPVEHERMDKVRITGPNGKVEEVDFIYAMGAEKGAQKLQWIGSNPIGPSQQGGGVDQNYVMSVMSMFPPTNDGIMRAIEELRKRPGYEHAHVLEHPLRLDKIDFGNGMIVDVIVGSGGPNPSWGWMPE